MMRGMKRVNFKHDGGIDFSRWNLDAMDIFMSVVAQRCVALAFEDDDTYAYFAAEGGPYGDGLGNDAPDPLTIYVRIALTSGGAECPTWAFNLREAICDDLKELAEGHREPEGFKNIRNALRDLAAEIDQALQEADK